jgi:hypothetical protein
MLKKWGGRNCFYILGVQGMFRLIFGSNLISFIKIRNIKKELKNMNGGSDSKEVEVTLKVDLVE